MPVTSKDINTTFIQSQQEFNTQVEGRLKGLEIIVQNLTNEVKDTNQSLREVITVIDAFKDDVRLSMQNASTPNWQLITVLATLLLTIIGLGVGLITMISNGHGNDICNLSTKISAIEQKSTDEYYKHGMQDGWRTSITDNINILNTKLEDLHTWKLNNSNDLAAIKAKTDNLEKLLNIIETRQYGDRIDRLNTEQQKHLLK